ncbi:MAG: cobalamin-binding protein, partial [Chloroflexi bacterium]
MGNEILQQIYDCVVNGDQHETAQLVQQAVDSGLSPASILNEGMVAAMAHVGKLFEEGEFYVPEMLIAARAMQAGMGVLKPHLIQSDYKPEGK